MQLKSGNACQSKAKTDFDDQAAPILILKTQAGEQQVRMGVSPGNVLDGTAPPQLAQQILTAHLQSELRQAPPNGISQAELKRTGTSCNKPCRSKRSSTTSNTAGSTASVGETGRHARSVAPTTGAASNPSSGWTLRRAPQLVPHSNAGCPRSRAFRDRIPRTPRYWDLDRGLAERTPSEGT